MTGNLLARKHLRIGRLLIRGACDLVHIGIGGRVGIIASRVSDLDGVANVQSRWPALAMRWKYPARLTDPVHDEIRVRVERDGCAIRGDVSDGINRLQRRVRICSSSRCWPSNN
jgi:hypothetical protein